MKLAKFFVATVASAIGWWAGSFVGLMTSMMLSVIAYAVAVYAVQRTLGEYMD